MLRQHWVKRAFPKLLPLVDQALVSGGNFITVILGARLLGLEGQGKFGYILSAYLSVSIFSQASIYQVASVDAPYSDHDHYYDFISLLQTFLSLGVSAITMVALFFISKHSGWNISAFEVVSIFIFLTLQQWADFMRRGSYIFRDVNAAVWSSLLVYPIRVLLILWARPHNILIFVWIMIATTFIPSGNHLYKLWKQNIDFKSFFLFLKKHYGRVKWLIMSSPFVWVWGNVPVFLLGIYSGFTQVAIFSTLRSITNMANVLMELLETSVSATAGRQYAQNGGNGLRELISKVMLVGVAAWFFVLVLLFISRYAIVQLLVGDAYVPYSNLLVLLWLGTLATFSYRTSSVKIRTAGQTAIIFVSLFLGAVSSLIFSIVLIPEISLYGASIALIIAPLIMWAVQSILESEKVSRKLAVYFFNEPIERR
jgi:O-antigen/teichoic acid export membrane protein